jgi:trehalose synthase
MDDPQENAAMVNALQRSADVIVQKSLAEGFGLTVAEAMWKSRPVVASRLGGIQDQIEHGFSGLLLDDPRDLQAFGSAVNGLLNDPAAAAAMGAAAAERVRDHFLAPHSLLAYFELLGHLLGARPTPGAMTANANATDILDSQRGMAVDNGDPGAARSLPPTATTNRRL